MKSFYLTNLPKKLFDWIRRASLIAYDRTTPPPRTLTAALAVVPVLTKLSIKKTFYGLQIGHGFLPFSHATFTGVGVLYINPSR